MSESEERTKETIEHLQDPKVGDTFHEQYTFWIEVVFVGKNQLGQDVVVICEDYGRHLTIHTKEQFLKRFIMETVPPKSWIDYSKTVDTEYTCNGDFLDFYARYMPTQYISPKEKAKIAKEARREKIHAIVGKVIHTACLDKRDTVENAFVKLFEMLEVNIDDLENLTNNL